MFTELYNGSRYCLGIIICNFTVDLLIDISTREYERAESKGDSRDPFGYELTSHAVREILGIESLSRLKDQTGCELYNIFTYPCWLLH